MNKIKRPGGVMRPLNRINCLISFMLLLLPVGAANSVLAASTRIPDTGQTICYDAVRALSSCPEKGHPFFGQDAQYRGAPLDYRDNGDGTVTDQTTGLMWTKAVDAEKVSLKEARSMAAALVTGGHSDWRVPTIKELYSLMNFSGRTPMPGRRGAVRPIPYINTDYFDFKYGNTRTGERDIDAQWLSSTEYVFFTMHGARTLFGVNFADGRIKGYGYAGPNPRREKKFYVRFVRGGPYGQNDLVASADGTVTDRATGLTWAAGDSGRAMTWEAALAYARSSTLAGHTDWRLPNAKELQYIVDYTRSPDTTGSPAIDPVFTATPVTNEAGQTDFGHYWTSTTHLDGPRPDGAVTICFGRAMGKMHGQVMDVHGAGAQRSDPKSGENSIGRGPQGDARHGRNFVRLVRGGEAVLSPAPAAAPSAYPTVVRVDPGYGAGGGRPDTSGRSGPAMNGYNNLRGGMQGFVGRLDRDGDNRVSASEFDGPPDHFTRFDRNNDGYIAQDEAPKGPPPRGPRGGSPERN
jgi:hypothetical protein